VGEDLLYMYVLRSSIVSTQEPVNFTKICGVRKLQSRLGYRAALVA